ncbi:hypothetical protein RJT34_08279 [Clitoria ternatea]|uniref:PsbP C-terminal domain-containing protein n=1 Tax=Clitoria ternatea TaxID=43366 RepID=A0AAN9PUH3_CLITE
MLKYGMRTPDHFHKPKILIRILMNRVDDVALYNDVCIESIYVLLCILRMNDIVDRDRSARLIVRDMAINRNRRSKRVNKIRNGSREADLKGMASISWFSCLHMRPTASNFTAPLSDKAFISSGLSPPNLTLEHHQNTPFLPSSNHEGCAVNRRQLILHTAVAALAAIATVPNALAINDVSEDVRVYTDDENKFKIEVPQEWQIGTGEPDGFKSVTAFYPTDASNSSVTVAITGIGPDFTRMESFGKVDEFAQTLVSGIDRSWQRPPGVAAKLIDCRSSNGIYYIEYTLQNPGESRKHLYSALGMASNGWYNRLYTVTGQFAEEDANKYASKIQKAVGSFRFI